MERLSFFMIGVNEWYSDECPYLAWKVLDLLGMNDLWSINHRSEIGFFHFCWLLILNLQKNTEQLGKCLQCAKVFFSKRIHSFAIQQTWFSCYIYSFILKSEIPKKRLSSSCWKTYYLVEYGGRIGWRREVMGKERDNQQIGMDCLYT